MILSAAPQFTRDIIPLTMIMSQKSFGANILLILRTTFGALVCGFWDPEGKQWVFFCLFVVVCCCCFFHLKQGVLERILICRQSLFQSSVSRQTCHLLASLFPKEETQQQNLSHPLWCKIFCMWIVSPFLYQLQPPLISFVLLIYPILRKKCCIYQAIDESLVCQ